MRRAGARILRRAAIGAMLVEAFFAWPAAADIYWANEGTSTIGRAEGDGTSPNGSFISGTDLATTAHAVAVDASYVYWAHDGTAGVAGNVGRAPLDDAASAQPFFVTTTDSPKGLTLDQAGIYWTQATPGTGAIGRANVFNGNVTNQSHVSNIAAAGGTPCGLTTDADKFFWALTGAPGKVMRSHGTFPPFTEFVPAAFPAGTTADPCGVAEANGLVYWANRGNDTIGRVDLTGTTLQSPIPTGAGPCGVAVDGAYVYWTEQGTDTINRAELDGSNPNAGDEFPIAAGSGADPCGIAVDPTAAAEPAVQTFAATPIGARSDTATLVLRNTSSSVLDTSGVSLAGSDPDDFELVGDGCSINVVPAGQICVLNVDFTPTQAGARQAVLRVTTNASGSPTDFALAGEGLMPSPEPPPGTPPTEPAKFARSLSISYSGGPGRFNGRLSSASAACTRAQRVVVFKRRRGDDRRVGSDQTNDTGRWRVAEKEAEGRFYATARQSALSSGETCLEAGSKTLKVG